MIDQITDFFTMLLMAKKKINKILVINPGGTSTKIALFEDYTEKILENIRHDGKELERCETIIRQLKLRLNTIYDFLKRNSIEIKSLSAVVGRGGPITPVPSGTYIIDKALIDVIEKGKVMVEHASLLGAPLALSITKDTDIPSFIVDPVCVDEMIEEAKLSGLPQVPKKAISHALSVKAVSRATAKKLGKSFEDINIISVHLGSGFTIAAQRKGKQIYHNDATASGPMAPTRAGDLPTVDFARLVIAEKYNAEQVKKLLIQNGGWKAHTGTDNIIDIYSKIDKGSKNARLAVDATILQIAKEIGGMYAILNGKVDAIAITGGVAECNRFIDELRAKLIWFMGPVHIFPGSLEMKALAEGALRVITGKIKAKKFEPYLK
jgi:butyrate kinase